MQTAFRLLELAAVLFATCVLFAVAVVVPAGPAAAPLRRRLPYVRALVGLVALAGLLALTACGGGDPEDHTAAQQQGTTEPNAKMGTPRPPCQTTPELCK